MASQPGLIYVSDRAPGIRRIRRGRRFEYVYRGRRIVAAHTLERIRRLAIPPAYDDVWICPQAEGHLQATGRDARGRKQYRYHAAWRAARDGDKFDRMLEFGRRLPRLRQRLRRDLKLKGLPRDKVIATVVTLLDETLMRVGNVEYVRQNGSYGLTTLHDRHVRFLRHDRAEISFRGKSGKQQEVTLTDAHLTRILRRCQELPGQQLFQYVDADGRRHGVDSTQVNAYLLEAMGTSRSGDGFTAKDFRTWGATVRAIELLSRIPPVDRPSERYVKSQIVQICSRVAGELGNTPAVCRKSYINPWVFEAWRDGLMNLRRPQPGANGSQPTRGPNHKLERYAIELLRRRHQVLGTNSRRKGARHATRSAAWLTGTRRAAYELHGTRR